MTTLEQLIRLANQLDDNDHHAAADVIDGFLEKTADVNDYLNAAERDAVSIANSVKRLGISDYELARDLKELEYHLRALRAEMAAVKTSALELEMTKDVEVREDEETDEDDEEVEHKKKKITLKFD